MFGPNRMAVKGWSGLILPVALWAFGSGCSSEPGFHSAWPEEGTRTWAGPEYWANRLQDWRIAGGRLECVEGRAEKPMRTVHLLTRALGPAEGTLEMSVRTGVLSEAGSRAEQSWTGFLIGAGGADLDYRAAALVHHLPGRGGGFIAALDGNHQIVFRDNAAPQDGDPYPMLASPPTERQRGSRPEYDRESDIDIELRLQAVPAGGNYDVTVAAYDAKSGDLIDAKKLAGIPPSRLVGNLALVSNPGPAGARYWFRDWQVSGDKVEQHDERRFGPILGAQHTLHRDILKLTAQFPPLGEGDSREVFLEIRRQPSDPWQQVGAATIIAPGFTAPFRVEDWDSTQDTQYRVRYALRQADGRSQDHFWEGTIRREPVAKENIVVAAFTGNSNAGSGADVDRFPDAAQVRWTRENLWFPHDDIAAAVAQHNPDLLFFSGDQVYETHSPTRAERQPPERAMLDYLYKWYLWVWAYRDLARDIPSLPIPDDHDVFHGNIWGMGGLPSPGNDHNNGGYLQTPEFVNMVERTMTSHFPDPYDPTPIEQGIGVYYTALDYGGISFAIFEDRKFKSPPTIVKDAKIEDGHILTPNYPGQRADVPGAVLLGERQLKFLRDWATDWSGGVIMKAALSQTIFANLQIRDGKRDQDLDSNGWPQTGRAKALAELRRAHALHIAGDQHLASVIHHGIDEWNDANYSFCVPSVANFYLRFWNPPFEGKNRKPGAPSYTGEHLDGLGNKLTVYAVANPKERDELTDQELSRGRVELHRKAPGYGIVRFHKPERTMTIECWPRHADPGNPAGQYPGWPLTISTEDNYGRRPRAYLPTLNITGFEGPVVQIIDEAGGEVVYTLRIKGTRFRPKVFKSGSYTIRVGEPGTQRMRELKNIRSIGLDGAEVLEVQF